MADKPLYAARARARALLTHAAPTPARPHYPSAGGENSRRRRRSSRGRSIGGRSPAPAWPGTHRRRAVEHRRAAWEAFHVALYGRSRARPLQEPRARNTLFRYLPQRCLGLWGGRLRWLSGHLWSAPRFQHKTRAWALVRRPPPHDGIRHIPSQMEATTL